MKVSVCITVFNEEGSVSKLLDSLLSQTKKPSEIVIVDGGSSDKTVQIIRHWQKKDKRIKLLVEKCSRSRGRNMSVELAKNGIIAMTDAGCLPRKDWLDAITCPFENKNIEISAGFYKMTCKRPIQRALSVFLGTHESDFDITFLPSTRSIAFKKSLWEKVGGFPENLDDTAEDTVFSKKAIDEKAKFTRVKDAVVEWGMPETFSEGINKMYLYARGDAKSGVWLHPGKGLASHNIKAISILFRYILVLILLLYSFVNPPLILLIVLLIVLYSLWAFQKVYLKTQDIVSGLWGILIQFSSDLMVMKGFFSGNIKKWLKINL